ncbi:TetR/AcrR family transcriptional regulator [Amycolatopsis sp. FDAARGOS 1241]|uniref:TetR/AcrR family transcriptional regulator n=1 Tax=Amycolatopsis sp. FDAARGOS 1241 TaxID=2778070 RepID=UPI00194F44BB|nr:helix-turn-helix domain-containing protein [Amycolatopsis sp. FDAARGOS 1241]QRP43178.1 helix-turn-helix transcriptional regulator [Amycolatopsis sp. FDAARGOS 1241]
MANYHSPRRTLAAEATRTAIVETARRLFSERGYAAVTIAHLAEGAGVAVPTVYASAGGKAQILRLLIGEAVHDPAVAQTLALVAAAGSAAEMVRATAAGVRRRSAKNQPSSEVFRSRLSSLTRTPAVLISSEPRSEGSPKGEG